MKRYDTILLESELTINNHLYWLKNTTGKISNKSKTHSVGQNQKPSLHTGDTGMVSSWMN